MHSPQQTYTLTLFSLQDNTLNSIKHCTVSQNSLSSSLKSGFPNVSQLRSFGADPRSLQPAERRFRPQRRAEAKHQPPPWAPPRRLPAGLAGPAVKPGRRKDGPGSLREDSRAPAGNRALPAAAERGTQPSTAPGSAGRTEGARRRSPRSLRARSVPAAPGAAGRAERGRRAPRPQRPELRAGRKRALQRAGAASSDLQARTERGSCARRGREGGVAASPGASGGESRPHRGRPQCPPPGPGRLRGCRAAAVPSLRPQPSP